MISIQFSSGDKARVMLQNPLTIIALVLTLLGLALFFRFDGFNGLNDLRYAFSKTAVVKGYITDARSTSVVLDYEDQYHFSFPVDGNTVYGNSFTSIYYYDIDEQVDIEYVVSNPDISRIVGTSDNREYSSMIGLIVMLVMPLLAIFPYRKLKKLELILSDAIIAKAEWHATKETPVEVNEETLYKIIYTFSVDAKQYEINKRSTTPARYEKDVQVIYSKANPAKNMFAEKLPHFLRKRVVKRRS